MTLHVMPDVERLVIQYLLDVTEVTDEVGQRIGSKKNGPFPRIAASRSGGGGQVIPAHIEAGRITLEVLDDLEKDGGSKGRSNRIARITKAAMFEMVNEPYEEAVVTDVVCVLGPLWDPDPVTGRPRYLLDFIVSAHPLASS